MEHWPLYAFKELVDDALDACEEAGVAPVVSVAVGDGKIVVTDNGPGIPDETVEAVLDFSVRVSSREAYVVADARRSRQCAQAPRPTHAPVRHARRPIHLRWTRRCKSGDERGGHQ